MLEQRLRARGGTAQGKSSARQTDSASSFGFRPGRSAHQALDRAKAHIAAGQRWVVDLDLEKFFDRMSHDVLMGRLARWIKDRRILKLIRANLREGIREGHRQPAQRRDPAGGAALGAVIQYPAR